MFKIRLANLLIGIDNRYPYMEKLCAAYRCEDFEKVAFTVSVSEDECLLEQKNSPVYATISYCESICLYRKIALELLKYDGLLMHAAAVCVDDECYLFAAKSGTGKTTHIRLWCDQFGARAQVLNGDKPILRLIDGRFYAFGSPFCGKEQLGSNISKPVKALCFIARGRENRIERISPSDTMGRIFHQLLIPRKEDDMHIFMSLTEQLLLKVSCYLLHCNMEPEAALVAYNGMKGQ